MKLINVGLISALAGAIVTGLGGPASSSTLVPYSFSRGYDTTSDPNLVEISWLNGEFAAIDANEDSIITADEISWFDATLTFSGDLQDTINSTGEEINLSSFEYVIDTNKLNFDVATLYRPGRGGFTGNSHWSVDFSRNIDSFLLSDMSFSGVDPSSTGVVVETALVTLGPGPTAVPESGNLLAMGLLGLGLLWGRKKAW